MFKNIHSFIVPLSFLFTLSSTQAQTIDTVSLHDKLQMKLSPDTPVDIAMAKMIFSIIKESEQGKSMSLAQKTLLAGDIAFEFRQQSLPWTEEDQKNHNTNKPLVQDFEKVKSQIKKNEGMAHFFKSKLNAPTLSYIEQRVLHDILRIEEKRLAYEEKVRGGREIYQAIRDYALKNEGKVTSMQGAKLTSNEILRELFIQKRILKESHFYVDGMKGFHKGDEKINGQNALASGENMWAINVSANLMNSRMHMPLLIAPLKKVKGKWIADKDAYNGNVIVVQLDGFTDVLKVGPNGEILTEFGDLLSPGHPCWSNFNGAQDSPDFRLPQKKAK